MNPNYLLLGVISLFLVSILSVHNVNAQDDDDFDDGVVSEVSLSLIIIFFLSFYLIFVKNAGDWHQCFA